MHFSGNQLEPGEEVIVSFQDHWIVMIMPVFLYILGWSLFLFLIFTAQQLRPTTFISGFAVSIIAFFVLFLTHHLFFLLLLEYLISGLIVTNKRIIHTHYFPFFVDDVVYIEIFEIHAIEKKKHGILRILFNFGDVVLSVSGKGEVITSQFMRHPSRFINFIEAIKSGKPLSDVTLKSTGATCLPKFHYLLK